MSTSLKTQIPGLALMRQPEPGHRLVFPGNLSRGIAGADSSGYNQVSDVLVTQTVDGVDINEIYREFQETITLQNAGRTTIVDLLTFPVTKNSESVSQLSGTSFERSTEYGEPRGARQKPTTFWLGYDFHWNDVATRYTWMYLSEATAAEVEGIHSAILEADNQLVFTEVLKALYQKDNRLATIDGRETNVYALYNADGTVPPSYKSNTFDGTHTHYLVSGAATVDSGDLDAMMEHLRHHGYDISNGVQWIFGVNSVEGEVIRTFRIDNGDKFDFIPATNQPLELILEPGQTVAGSRPAPTYRGLNVIGAYGAAIIVEDDNFPPHYVLLLGSGGRANLNNPVGFREHVTPGLRGLRLVKGPSADYPLIDSFYNHGFGTGIRQRGGSVVMQIKASGSYTPPTQYIYD